jgi:hypothetical protein
VFEFRREKNVLTFGVGCIRTGDRDAGGAGAGIEFDDHRLNRACRAVREPDDKREAAVDDRAARVEQRPRPGRVAGHERLLILAEHKDSA